MTHSNNGREYLKLSEAKAGMIVELDDGFCCHVPGKAFLYNSDGVTYFYCDSGKHDIASQCEDDIHCVGMFKCD